MTIPTPGSVTDAEWKRLTKQALDPVLAGKISVSAKTGAYTIARGDSLVLVDATGAAVTITLPAANPYSGLQFTIKKTDASANAVTVDGSGAETIDGMATRALAAQYQSITIVSDGTGWQIT